MEKTVQSNNITQMVKTIKRLRSNSSHTAGLNVDLDPFFELAELMVEMS